VHGSRGGEKGDTQGRQGEKASSSLRRWDSAESQPQVPLGGVFHGEGKKRGERRKSGSPGKGNFAFNVQKEKSLAGAQEK